MGKIRLSYFGFGWVGFFLLLWLINPVKFFPTPLEVYHAFPDLWYNQGLGYKLFTSFSLSLEASIWIFVICYSLALLTVMPIFKPLALLISSSRFNGLVGVPLIFMSIFHNDHKVKVSLLVLGVGVFTLLSFVRVFESIPNELFDLATTLRMNKWRAVFEVVVLGSFDQVIEVMRINIAMIWMMLPMVEGAYRGEGGIGVLLLDESKHFNLDAVFCVMILVLSLGLLQDFMLGMFKKIVCPFSV